jgi:hypothetical protein
MLQDAKFRFLPGDSPASLQSLDSFNQKAAQSLRMLFVLPFVLGNLYPAEPPPAVQCLVMLARIVALCNSFRFVTTLPDCLDATVVRYRTARAAAYGPQIFFKIHNLTHYGYWCRKTGRSLREFSCIRFEAKHSAPKLSASIGRNFKNLIYSLSMKNQLQLCLQLLAEPGDFLPLKKRVDGFDYVFNGLVYRPGCFLHAGEKIFGKFNCSFVLTFPITSLLGKWTPCT